MLFFLWGVLRGKKKNSSPQTPNNREKSSAPQSVSSISTDKISLAENASMVESIEKVFVKFWINIIFFEYNKI